MLRARLEQVAGGARESLRAHGVPEVRRTKHLFCSLINKILFRLAREVNPVQAIGLWESGGGESAAGCRGVLRDRRFTAKDELRLAGEGFFQREENVGGDAAGCGSTAF